MSKQAIYPNQVVPLGLTNIVFVFGVFILWLGILILNKFIITREIIVPVLRWPDIVIGLIIYLKTAIDFAIFIGRLMSKYPGWKNRIVIEVGTALGNITGTLAILLIWDLFREVRPLMALMIVIASLVLLRLAEEGLEHVRDKAGNYKISLSGIVQTLDKILHTFNSLTGPVLNRIVPSIGIEDNKARGFSGLFFLGFTIPFILGLDDFAGYIPLFNVVNVFGFGTGVFLGHMLLNTALFISPKTTIKAVKNPIISFLGSIAFIGLAFWGLFEALKLLLFY